MTVVFHQKLPWRYFNMSSMAECHLKLYCDSGESCDSDEVEFLKCRLSHLGSSICYPRKLGIVS